MQIHLRTLFIAHLFGAFAGASIPALADVFISSEKDNQILVVRADGTPVNTIPVCKRPRHMAWANAEKKSIVVACGDSDQLGIVDLGQGKLVGSIPTAESPEIFALSPDGKFAYVSIEEGSQMVAYDMAAKKPLFSVKTGAEPEGVLVTPDGKRVYVTSEVTNTVHIIDVAKRTTVGQIKVGKRPRRLALIEDGAELWVTNELGASITIIDTTTQQVKSTLRLEVPGIRPADITPVGMLLSTDGKTVYVAMGKANHVAEIDAATHVVRGLVLVGKRAWGLALNKDGSRLYVANGLSDDMSIVDTALGKAIKTVPVGRIPHTILVN